MCGTKPLKNLRDCGLLPSMFLPAAVISLVAAQKYVNAEFYEYFIL